MISLHDVCESAFGAGNSTLSLTAKLNNAVMSETVGAIGNLGRVRDDAGVRVRREIKNNLPVIKFPQFGFGLSSGARFKSALCGGLLALTLCFPVFALEPPSIGKVIPHRLAKEETDRNAGTKTDQKPDHRRGQVLSEKRSDIHDGYSYVFGCFLGLITGLSILYIPMLIVAIKNYMEFKKSEEKNPIGGRKNDQC